MSGRQLVFALSVVSAVLFALPAVASATPAHIDTAEVFPFRISPGISASALETTSGEKIVCHLGVEGSGSFENTTTGTINLIFHGCTSSGINCNSAGQPAGRIVTTALPFHLIMLGPSSPGILITPNGGHFATFNCTIFVKREVKGTGVLGTITDPKCSEANTTATLAFEQQANTGIQRHVFYTFQEYHLTSNGTKAALTAVGAGHFGEFRSLKCT